MKRLKLQIRFALLLIGFALTACERSEMTVPAFSGGSGAAPIAAPAGGSAPAQPLAPPMPMIDNPEAKTSETEEDVFADSASEARDKCQKRAEWLSNNGGGVTAAIGVRNVKGKLYKCKLSSEVTP